MHLYGRLRRLTATRCSGNPVCRLGVYDLISSCCCLHTYSLPLGLCTVRHHHHVHRDCQLRLQNAPVGSRERLSQLLVLLSWRLVIRALLCLANHPERIHVHVTDDLIVADGMGRVFVSGQVCIQAGEDPCGCAPPQPPQILVALVADNQVWSLMGNGRFNTASIILPNTMHVQVAPLLEVVGTLNTRPTTEPLCPMASNGCVLLL